MKRSMLLLVWAITIMIAGASSAIASVKYITGSQIKNGSIAGVDIKDGSISKKDLAPTARITSVRGPRGPVGPMGPAGPSGSTGAQGPSGPSGPAQQVTSATSSAWISGGAEMSLTAFCPAGKTATGGGGWYSVDDIGLYVTQSMSTAPVDGVQATGWTVTFYNSQGYDVWASAEAMCV